MSKTSIQIKEGVEAELLWDPNVNAAQIGVGVNKGAVLFSARQSYAERTGPRGSASAVRIALLPPSSICGPKHMGIVMAQVSKVKTL